MSDSPEPAPQTTQAPPTFEPVPGRARHDGWTPDRQRRFVEALRRTGIVGAAARSVGMSSKSAYALRRRAGEDSGFAAAWNAAVREGEEVALAITLDRCLEGEMVPVFRGDRQVGERRRYDNRLLIAALRAVNARERRAAGPAPPDTPDAAPL